MEHLNLSYITMITKVNAPKGAIDFQPIRLINMLIKIISKIVASRLSFVLDTLVS